MPNLIKCSSMLVLSRQQMTTPAGGLNPSHTCAKIDIRCTSGETGVIQICLTDHKKNEAKNTFYVYVHFVYLIQRLYADYSRNREEEEEKKNPNQTLPLNILLPFCRYPCTNINNRRVHGYIDIKKIMTKLERLLSGHDVVCRRVYLENRTGEYSLRFEQIVSCQS